MVFREIQGGDDGVGEIVGTGIAALGIAAFDVEERTMYGE